MAPKIARPLFLFSVILFLAVFQDVGRGDQRAWGAPARKSSSAEDVAFTFYKLSNTAPDFQRWVDKTPVPKEVTVAAQPRYRRAMMHRLQTLYQNYNSGKPLIVQASARITLRVPPKTRGPLIVSGDWFQPGYDIKFGPDSKAPYFPYPVADQWITVVAKDIERYMALDMSAEEVEALKPDLGLVGGMRYTSVVLTFTLKPISADATTPLHLNGVDQWLVMAEIVNLSLWNQKGELVWQTQDKRHIPPVQKEIEDLFRE